jgi:hypothetical protein
MKQPRKPTSYHRISIESATTKEKILEISEVTRESMKDIVVRLVNEEHKKLKEVIK